MPIPEKREPPVPGKTVWALRTGTAALFGAWMCYEWGRWPNSSLMFGPLALIRYNGLNLVDVVTSAVLLPLLFAFLLRPHVLTFCLSLLGTLIWLCLGSIPMTVSC
jgi:hypothetical protein